MPIDEPFPVVVLVFEDLLDGVDDFVQLLMLPLEHLKHQIVRQWQFGGLFVLAARLDHV